MRRFLLGLAVAVPAMGSAQQPQPQPFERTVTVNATAMVEREPERAVIMLAVESPAATAQLAARANATKMDALVAALRKLGISGPNVRTTARSEERRVGKECRSRGSPYP